MIDENGDCKMYDNKEEIWEFMKKLKVGSKVMYTQVYNNGEVKEGIITEIKEHFYEKDPICKHCIGYIRINNDELQCMLSDLGDKIGNIYNFKIKRIIEDFITEEEFML